MTTLCLEKTPSSQKERLIPQAPPIDFQKTTLMPMVEPWKQKINDNIIITAGFIEPSTISSKLIYEFSFSILPASDQLLFEMLVIQWNQERGITSSITEMAMCPSYQRIIAMGEGRAVPLILRQLEKEGDDPDHWFWALRFLTGENPVPSEFRGNMKIMAKTWLEWARDRYDW